MDNQFNFEALRETLRSMTRAEVSEVCIAAGVKLSTVSKFRGGHTHEIGGGKTEALLHALRKRKPKPKRRATEQQGA